MPHEVIMPALGMAQDTGLIVAWHKAPGDAVKTGDVLFEVETDKATMEVEAQADGFLNQVRHHAGQDVPVGEVIALIGSTAEAVETGDAPVTAAPADATALPAGHNVIMPALGMAQDTGLIVAWHKALGDAVRASDILFEVETDKATMEVEAGVDGFVAALLAEAGEAAPVGETIAVISAKKPENAVKVSRAGAPAPAAPPASVQPAPKPEAKAAEPNTPARKPSAPVRADRRILASPKARRLALEQGLDLNRLVEAGYAQPYHAADIDILKSLPAETGATVQAASRRLTAELVTDGFAAFADWAKKHAELGDASALLAGLAAGSLARDHATIAVESFGQSRCYSVPAGPLNGITRADPDIAADLHLRDLRMSPITCVALGAEEAPVLTLTRSGAGLSITLECASHHLTAAQAVALVSEFAGRMEQPLRHLL
ncbi:MAG: pyruvate dehydrogenase [Rhodobacter sp.]|nr:pyruvate dehydrogenase [Rhodobacter sp.]